MATTKQLVANRQNALKGSVKTNKGKEITKYNAVRHGVLMSVLLDYEHNEADIIQNKLIEEYQPQSITEELLIESMVLSYMRRQRACFQELHASIIPSYEPTSSGAETYLRYITTSERQFYRALHELQLIEAIRNGIRPTSIAVDFIGNVKSD